MAHKIFSSAELSCDLGLGSSAMPTRVSFILAGSWHRLLSITSASNFEVLVFRNQGNRLSDQMSVIAGPNQLFIGGPYLTRYFLMNLKTSLRVKLDSLQIAHHDANHVIT